MNLYTYWHFIIYSLYDKFSRDKHFGIFATGLFSVFVGFFVIGIIGIALYFTNYEKLLEAKDTIYIIIPLMIGNYIYFNKKRQIELYSAFKAGRSIKKDVASVFISLFSILLFVIAARLNMK